MNREFLKVNEAINILMETGRYKNITALSKALAMTPSYLDKLRHGKEGRSAKPLIDKLIKDFEFKSSFFYHTESSESLPLNIIYIPVKVHAGQAKANIEEIVRENEVENFRFPSFMNLNGELYAFEVVGDSMLPTLVNGDLIICKKLEDVKDIADNKIYVIIFQNEFLVKRLSKKIFDGKFVGIYLNSDNDLPEFKRKPIENKFFEGLKGHVFKVIKRISINDLL